MFITAVFLLSQVANAPSASDCTLDHIEATPGCDAIAAFAVCLANTLPTDSRRVTAEKALAEAQEKVRGVFFLVMCTVDPYVGSHVRGRTRRFYRRSIHKCCCQSQSLFV
jgi:hypothetical protein